jgi:hypothetical protein
LPALILLDKNIVQITMSSNSIRRTAFVRLSEGAASDRPDTSDSLEPFLARLMAFPDAFPGPALEMLSLRISSRTSGGSLIFDA